MATVAQAAIGAGAIIAAGVLEELTHAIAARPWAVKQRANWRRVEIIHELPETTPESVDKWINLAPFFVGLAALASLYLGWGLPPLSDETVLLYIAWAWFTTPSLTDLQEAFADGVAGDGWADERYRGAWVGLSIESVGLLLAFGKDELLQLMFGHPTAAFGVSERLIADAYLTRAAVLISIAGGLWVFIRIWLAERDTDSAECGLFMRTDEKPQ
jgi:hypothetical protein